ncbi:MAG: hypothetical protein EAZ89_16095 [Bacteroidetes bacterium]|nr:MAG: hypothetical protein EAZ89_16095 [Bacteroidota bacterium]
MKKNILLLTLVFCCACDPCIEYKITGLNIDLAFADRQNIHSSDTVDLHTADTLSHTAAIFLSFDPVIIPLGERKEHPFFPPLVPCDGFLVSDGDSIIDIDIQFETRNGTVIRMLPFSMEGDSTHLQITYMFNGEEFWPNHHSPDSYEELYNHYVDGSGDFHYILFDHEFFPVKLPAQVKGAAKLIVHMSFKSGKKFSASKKYYVK